MQALWCHASKGRGVSRCSWQVLCAQLSQACAFSTQSNCSTALVTSACNSEAGEHRPVGLQARQSQAVSFGSAGRRTGGRDVLCTPTPAQTSLGFSEHERESAPAQPHAASRWQSQPHLVRSSWRHQPLTPSRLFTTTAAAHNSSSSSSSSGINTDSSGSSTGTVSYVADAAIDRKADPTQGFVKGGYTVDMVSGGRGVTGGWGLFAVRVCVRGGGVCDDDGCGGGSEG